MNHPFLAQQSTFVQTFKFNRLKSQYSSSFAFGVGGNVKQFGKLNESGKLIWEHTYEFLGTICNKGARVGS